MFRRSIITCSILACVGSLSPASSDTLQDLLAQTLASNPEIKSADAETEGATYATLEARSRMLPSVTASLESNRTSLNNGAFRGSNVLGLSARQLLFNGGAAVKGYQSSRATAEGVAEKGRETEQRLMQRAANAYVSAARGKAVLRLRQAYLQETQQQLHVVQRRFEEGEGTRTDVDQIYTQLHDAEAQLAAAEAELAQAMTEIETVAGHRAEVAQLGLFPARVLPPTLQERLSIALKGNAGIAQAERQLLAAHYGVWAETAAFGPSLTAAADYARSYDGKFRDPQSETKIGLELTVPITTGGRGYARHKSARSFEQQRAYDLAAIRNEVTQTVKAADSAYDGARRRLAAAKLAVNSANATLNGMRLEFQQGERSLSDVISARRELLARQEELETAKEASWQAGVAILAAMGSLSPDALGSVHDIQTGSITPVAAINDSTTATAALAQLKPIKAQGKAMPLAATKKAATPKPVSKTKAAKRAPVLKAKPKPEATAMLPLRSTLQ